MSLVPRPVSETLIAESIRSHFPDVAAAHDISVQRNIANAVMEGVAPYADSRYTTLLLMIQQIQVEIAAIRAKIGG